MITQSGNGHLELKQVTPGKYTIEFEEITELDSPIAQTVYVKPNEQLGPIVGTIPKQLQGL